MATSLWISFRTLEKLVRAAAESSGEGRIDLAAAAPDDALVEEWQRYEVELRYALKEWLYPRLDGLTLRSTEGHRSPRRPLVEDADDLADELLDRGDASHAVYLTLAEDDRAIWDGRWREWLDEDEADDLSSHLSLRLRGYAESLPVALERAAWGTGAPAEDYEARFGTAA